MEKSRIKRLEQNSNSQLGYTKDLLKKNMVSRIPILESNSSSTLPPTLNEMEAPTPFVFYDYFDIKDFVWLEEEKCIHISAYFSFLQEQEKIDLKGSLYDKQTGALIGEIDFPSQAKVTKAQINQYIELEDDLKPSQLSLVIETKICNSNGGITNIAASRVSCASCEDSIVTLDPKYQHIYPKKENSTVYFGSYADYDSRYYRNTNDPNNIVISLYRKPNLEGDCDYVCNYGHVGSTAKLGIPAKGVINMGSSVTIKNVANQKATIEKINGGGVAATSTSFITPIISGGNIQYEINTNWGSAAPQPGEMESFYYNFELSLTFDYSINASSADRTFQFRVTSKEPTEYGTNHITYRVLPLRIMWGCFSKDTLVLTPDGYKKIIDLKIGDYVVSNNKNVKIRNIWSGYENELFKISYNDKNIKLTYNHPILTNRGFIRASELELTDKLVGGNKELIGITSIEKVIYDSEVINLSLESDDHTLIAEDVVVGDMEMQNMEVNNE